MTDNTSNTNDVSTDAAIDAAVAATPTAPKRQRGRPADPDGGMGRARTLYAGLTAEQQKDRKGVIKAFTEIQPKPLSEGTAAAYYSVIKRAEKAALAAATV